MLYNERYTYYYASLKIACQMELRKAGQTVGKIWLSIGLSGLVIGYIYPITGRAAKDSSVFSTLLRPPGPHTIFFHQLSYKVDTLISSVYIFYKATNIDHSCSESPDIGNSVKLGYLLVDFRLPVL